MYLKSLTKAIQNVDLQLKTFLRLKLINSGKRGFSDHLYLVNRPIPKVSVSIESVTKLGNFGEVFSVYLSATYHLGYIVNSIMNVTNQSDSYMFIGTPELDKSNIKIDIVYFDENIHILRNNISESYMIIPAVSAKFPVPIIPSIPKY